MEPRERGDPGLPCDRFRASGSVRPAVPAGVAQVPRAPPRRRTYARTSWRSGEALTATSVRSECEDNCGGGDDQDSDDYVSVNAVGQHSANRTYYWEYSHSWLAAGAAWTTGRIKHRSFECVPQRGSPAIKCTYI